MHILNVQQSGTTVVGLACNPPALKIACVTLFFPMFSAVIIDFVLLHFGLGRLARSEHV